MGASDDMEGVFASGIAAADDVYGQVLKYPVRAADMKPFLQIEPKCHRTKTFGPDFDGRGIQAFRRNSDGFSGERVFPRRGRDNISGLGVSDCPDQLICRTDDDFFGFGAVITALRPHGHGAPIRWQCNRGRARFRSEFVPWVRRG